MGWFDRLMGRELPERKDAQRIYFRLLEQSRDTSFFGPGKFADDYDGRIDVIALHQAIMMHRLRTEGRDGDLLQQALFDEMKDDFEIALREEGISDTGVKKRIKPIIGHFYDRLKTYNDALQSDAAGQALSDSFILSEGGSGGFDETLAGYALEWLDALKQDSLKTITAARFYFPTV